MLVLGYLVSQLNFRIQMMGKVSVSVTVAKVPRGLFYLVIRYMIFRESAEEIYKQPSHFQMFLGCSFTVP